MEEGVGIHLFMLFVVLGTSVWVVIDAHSIGVSKGKIKGMGDMGPWGWFFGCLLLWIIVFPFYLVRREAFKKVKTAMPRRCIHCEKYYENDPAFCPNCGERLKLFE